ncbi:MULTISPECIES: ABC transporter permease [Rhodococcus]|jgi:ribose transport system permease protein|uniref:ABC transporter permease n=1 Tax=Rhodococcus oxybenzonivorans TaxID=1990687 RepID=A0AAE5AAF5_9NOCA|nr:MULTISPECIES: ABC transporter permease [Rhodococcus]MDV7242656.1 ABC transporter permease [Rhodococcus oxybenzonivorans]MDV7268764.1 ABC transporter permease [Rhodococcus oxybenzonivorans]MDV7276089.1 ABC transporter permease [Rhodococcus oxybenzonivorans]MDV7332144.1 ABC transporter permease [Rhodococcus oxybenzonivorans]MDV7344349.1 ABC transporter permease [Rhodococcus oxybenzonivorans]
MTAALTERPRVSLRARIGSFDQAYLVLAITLVLVLVGGATTKNFLTTGNLSTILNLSAAFGIMAVGQAIVVIGKGLDLSIAGIGLGCAQATLALINQGWGQWQAVGAMILLAAFIGLANGVIIAFVEVPALFVTLATGMLAIGGIGILILDQNVYTVPPDSVLAGLSGTAFWSVPRPVLIAAIIFLAAWLFITFTTPGRLIRAMGDNFATARSSGAPVRPLQVLTYVLSALLAALAGFVTVAIQGSIQTTSSSFDPILFTALTVVVIGGVSLSGGRGTVLGVLAGALFVGILNSLLVMHGLSTAVQDLIRGAVLLGAIGFDAWLHPRNDETDKSGEL